MSTSRTLFMLDTLVDYETPIILPYHISDDPPSPLTIDSSCNSVYEDDLQIDLDEGSTASLDDLQGDYSSHSSASGEYGLLSAHSSAHSSTRVNSTLLLTPKQKCVFRLSPGSEDGDEEDGDDEIEQAFDEDEHGSQEISTISDTTHSDDSNARRFRNDCLKMSWASSSRLQDYFQDKKGWFLPENGFTPKAAQLALHRESVSNANGVKLHAHISGSPDHEPRRSDALVVLTLSSSESVPDDRNASPLALRLPSFRISALFTKLKPVLWISSLEVVHHQRPERQGMTAKGAFNSIQDIVLGSRFLQCLADRSPSLPVENRVVEQGVK